jgi:tetratricopeptide (TPR) repeat protein
MSTLPAITKKTVRGWAGETSYARGEQYARDGAILDARQQGMTLKARCAGSEVTPYRVEVTLDEKGITGAGCSCPVGSGRCKHVAALLLTWCETPEEFTEVEELATVLKRHSQDELIALIEQMVRIQPDLETLVETPLPITGKRRRPVSPQVYQRQADTAFHNAGDDWRASYGVATQLGTVRQIGDRFLQEQDHVGAAAVYRGICASVVANYESIQDEEGEIVNAANECVAGLGKCLEAVPSDAGLREEFLRAMFDVYRFDVRYGGIGLGDEVPNLVLAHATAEDRRGVAGWIRAEMAAPSRDWTRTHFGGFLLDLEADTLDDEAYLRLCRETGHRRDLVDRLLQLGRLDEAVQEVKQADENEITGLADLFAQHRQGDVAERLMRERSQTSKSVSILEWLKARHAARRDTASVLESAESIFRLRPSLSAYQEVRTLAQTLDRWDALRPELLAVLEKSPYSRSTLIQVYLDEGRIDQAVEAVKSESVTRHPHYESGMSIPVARAAEATRPKAALEIYRKQAEGLIQRQGRQNYREACQLLKKVRELHKELGEDAAWTSYLATVREQNRRLRAFQEELSAANL